MGRTEIGLFVCISYHLMWLLHAFVSFVLLFLCEIGLPNAGELIAFDAEFVQVQEEESVLTDTGSKVTVREARNTLARISLIDCSNDNVLVDDYIVPREPVVDYLTRFSGIVAKDLHPKQSPHHLVTMRSAYLKLRLMVERYVDLFGVRV